MADFPTIPGHRIERLLGKGGMGAVYLARQDVLDRQVALKVTLATLGELDETFAQRFVREAKTTARLKHPNIITVYEYGEHEGRCYMSMDYLERGSLSRILEVRRLAMDEVIDIGSGVCAGLAHAHRNGFVHRDIKPDNILLTADGIPVLTDFGIVKAIHGSTRLTGTNATLGSPAYMSPEQLMGDEGIDGRADLYSLGVVLFEMLEGRPPFSDEKDYAVGMKHLMEKPPSLSPLNARFQELISALLEKRAEQRPTSADLVARDLKALRNFSGAVQARPSRAAKQTTKTEPKPARSELGPPVKRASWLRRFRMPKRVLAVALLALVLIAWTVWFRDVRLAAIPLEIEALAGSPKERFLVAQTLRDRGDEERARFWWKQAMESGYPGAAYELARSIRFQDEARAARYLRIELADGYNQAVDLDAALLFGVLACNGRSYEDCDQAIEVLTRAAEDFDAASPELQMGEIYSTRLSEPDYPEAMSWYQRAAEKADGDASEQAMLKIAALYDDGLGVSRDRREATRWVLRAAESPNARFTTRKEAERRCGSPQLQAPGCDDLR